MCNNFPNIRITEGNNFSIILPLLSRTYVATRPIDEEIDPQQLQNVEVTFGGVSYTVQLTERGVQIDFPATLAVGTYNILLTAEYLGSNIRAAYESAVTIVPWSEQSTAEQYIAGSPIVLRAAYVLSGALTDAELEALKEEYREKNVQLDQAIADAEAAKREWEEKAADLDGVAQQSTLMQGVADIREDISHIDIDTTLLAKETTAETAKQAALDAKAAAQALAPVAQAAEAYNVGKTELAANITAKGVQASASETLPQLAQKVTAIAQQPVILSPSEVGDMYAKQLYGSLTTPNYWNLYEVLVQLLNDGRLLNYGGILLAEYYKGHDSLALSGAGTGGAYVTSDGGFYTEDITHYWNDDTDGKGNRWVAYCFSGASHPFEITNTDTCPRSIFIGRHVGKITSLVAGRISQIVVPDSATVIPNILDDFEGSYDQQWGKRIVMRVNEHSGNYMFFHLTTTESVYLEANKITRPLFRLQTTYNAGIKSLIIKANRIDFSGTSMFSTQGSAYVSGITDFIIHSEYIRGNISADSNSDILNELKVFTITTEDAIISFNLPGITTGSSRLYINAISNDKTKNVTLASVYSKNTKWNSFEEIKISQGWCKPLDIHLATTITESVIYSGILQRLKQDEPNCGDGVTITLGSTNLAKLTSEESLALLDELTNTYGYTFA